MDFGIFLIPCSRYAHGDTSDPAFFSATQRGFSVSAIAAVVFLMRLMLTRLCHTASVALRGLSLLGDLVASQFCEVVSTDHPCPP